MKCRLWTIVCLLLVLLLAGCGGARATGKFSDKDKPKPAVEK
jgi:hypothetical protein